MKLIQYRDAGLNTYTYFYKNEKNQTISPFFNSEKEAEDWLDQSKALVQGTNHELQRSS